MKLLLKKIVRFLSKYFIAAGFAFVTISSLSSIDLLAQSSQQRIIFPDYEAKAFHDKINLKINKLEQELAIKSQRIKAKKYPPETEKKELNKVRFKINFAINKYRQKGNIYFRKRNLPEPWGPKEQAPNNSTQSPASLTSDNTKKPETIITSNQQQPENVKTFRQKVFKSEPVNKSTTNIQSNKPQAQTISSTKLNSSKLNWGAITSAVFSLLLLFICFTAIVISFLKWNKSGTPVKFAMGCAVLSCFFGSILCSIIFCVILFSYSRSKPEPVKPVDVSVNDYFAQNAEGFHDLGAHLFAEAVAENNREKLFKAIEYLEKACAGDPESKAITVDLADAYMEVDSPSLTTMAIVLYESIFDSFENDPLLARITAGYQQLGNYEAAFALSEKRLECCPDNMRLPSAMQMGIIAISSGKIEEAKSAILANIKKRGDDPQLRLVIVSLMRAEGDKAGALAELDLVLKESKIDQRVQAYALKLKEKINHE